MNQPTAAPRQLTSSPPLTARDWSDTATNYRDAAALEWELLRVRAANRMDAYAARYTSRALTAWRDTHPLPHGA